MLPININNAQTDAQERVEEGVTDKLFERILMYFNEYKLIVILVVIKLIAIPVALYLAYKCKNGFDLVQFLLACCCWVLYIPYRLLVPCKNKGVPENNINKVKGKLKIKN